MLPDISFKFSVFSGTNLFVNIVPTLYVLIIYFQLVKGYVAVSYNIKLYFFIVNVIVEGFYFIDPCLNYLYILLQFFYSSFRYPTLFYKCFLCRQISDNKFYMFSRILSCYSIVCEVYPFTWFLELSVKCFLLCVSLLFVCLFTKCSIQ